jgi:hypothetical protein
MLSISKILTFASGALALSLTTAACSSSDSFSAEGTVSALSGAEVPASAKTIVVWSVAQEAPTAGYKFGSGTSTDATFVISLDEAPPEAAISEDGIGVGFIALVDADADVPDGEFGPDAAALLGISPKHAVVYKTADATGLEWSTDFEEGYSCGSCVEGEGEDFDTFTQSDCDEATIEVSTDAPALDVCVWM